jgi:hypothetical protein
MSSMTRSFAVGVAVLALITALVCALLELVDQVRRRKDRAPVPWLPRPWRWWIEFACFVVLTALRFAGIP